jgi:hypothetical protein
MGSRLRTRVIWIALLVAALLPSAAGAGMRTPLWGWNGDEFSLWPVVYVGHGGFSIPGLQVTEDSWSIPFIHKQDRPTERYDATPIYHHESGEEGFALGPRRETINDGVQGFANTVFDVLTVVTNTRPLVSDNNEEYETYREYGDPKQPIPGQEKGPVATLPAPVPAPPQEPVPPAAP